jgi:GT2 family glycosyltransferase
VSGLYVNNSSFWSPAYLQHSAWLEHSPFAFWITSVLQPRVFVELGTHGGYSYFAFCQAVKALALETRCNAVDRWEGDVHAGFYDDDVFARVQQYNDTNYASFSRLCRSTFDDALSEFPDASIDLLHIDGRHFYDDVRHDFESWEPKLSDRAVVLFHDTNVRDRGFGVHKLWSELVPRFPSFEFFHGGGLGVLGHGMNLPAELAGLLELHEDGAINDVRRSYVRLGETVQLGETLRAAEQLATESKKLEKKNASKIKAMKARLSKREATIAAFQRSASWRITVPLRLASSSLRNARRRLQLRPFPKIGPFENAAKIALSSYRFAVPSAVRRRVPNGLKYALKTRLKHALIMGRPAAAIKARAEAATNSQNWPEAVKHWSLVVKTQGSDAPSAAYAWLSHAHRRQGNLDKAELALRSAPSKYVQCPFILLENARNALAREDWTEAAHRWQKLMEVMGPEVPLDVYAGMSRAHRIQGSFDRAEAITQQGLAKYPDAIEIVQEQARIAMARKEWGPAAAMWRDVSKRLNEPSAAAMWRDVGKRLNEPSGTASTKLKISVAERLLDISAYREHIEEYARNRAMLDSQPEAKKIVVYSAIVSGYDTLKLPHRLDERLKYVVYSDGPLDGGGVFEIRPVTHFEHDHTRTARYVKTHPHILLDDCDVAIWVDSNILLTQNICGLVESFLKSGMPVAGIPHPIRRCVYEEAEACLSQGKDEHEVIQAQMEKYRSEGFQTDGLIESNVMMFDLKDSRTHVLLNDWWREIVGGSKRDQLSVNYVLGRNNMDFYNLTERPVSARNHAAFALVPHDSGNGPSALLNEALGCSPLDPYAGRPYADVRDQRVAAEKNRRIDIVVCVHNALDDVKACLESVRTARGADSQKLIIVDDGSDEPTARFLAEFARDISWIELHRNEDAGGYTKAANQGLAAATGDFVILLNSDTIVTNGWAEKMADAVFSTPGAGIVGPMSNAAGYQSIPQHRGTKNQTAINKLPPGMTPEDMNRCCEQWTTAGVLPTVPLVHGFCFGVRREVLDRIGFLDVHNFPRGYGEENDYCFRAVNAGFGLVIATHTYIFHSKSKSYSDKERIPLMKAASQAFTRLHGLGRVNRATKSMDKNPILVGLRERAAGLQPNPSPDTSKDIRSGGRPFQRVV